MENVKIGDIDLKPTRLALGAWSIGGWMWGGSDEKKSVETVIKALDKGVNIIDTAPVYGFGKSEKIVAKALKEVGDRDKIFIATKLGLKWKGEKISRDSSKERITKEIDDSLARLETDYIDLYQVHWPDENVPFEETAETLEELKRQGKIRAIGVSNYSPAQMDEFRKTAKLDSCQPPLNLFERETEKEILPYCKKNNIKTLAYGSICRGLLSGKMTKDRVFRFGDLRRADPKFQPGTIEKYLKAVDKLDEFAKENFGKQVIHLALRWILDKGTDIALLGARKPEQLEPIDKLWDWKLDDDSMKKIDVILEETLNEKHGPEFMAPPK